MVPVMANVEAPENFEKMVIVFGPIFDVGNY